MADSHPKCNLLLTMTPPLPLPKPQKREQIFKLMVLISQGRECLFFEVLHESLFDFIISFFIFSFFFFVGVGPGLKLFFPMFANVNSCHFFFHFRSKMTFQNLAEMWGNGTEIQPSIKTWHDEYDHSKWIIKNENNY